jgi:SAM-dependent methyltransferase
MGLNMPAIQMILDEHQYRPITGESLHIGRQTVNADDATLLGLFTATGLPTDRLIQAFRQDRDRVTRAANGNILDNCFLNAFSDAHYHCMDVSDYEGADILHDMNYDVPVDYHEKFDYIYDGSCIDNMFDPATFIKNVARMLKVGGRAILVNHASAYPGAYIAPSAEWYYSYFAVNDFADCKVYVGRALPGGHRLFVEYDLYSFNPYFTRDPEYDYSAACADIRTWLLCIVIAEKKADSTTEKIPIQSHYLTRDAPDWRKRSSVFEASARPLVTASRVPGVNDHLMHSDHYHYLGRI